MRRLPGPALALALAACAPPPAPLPKAPVPVGAGMALVARPVTPSHLQFGRFAYRGGLHLTSAATTLLHGLSDLEVDADGRVTAVSDNGDLFRGRLRLDRAGRLVGLEALSFVPLAGPDGPLPGGYRDAEGLAILPNGDMLVSFEQKPRILVYPAAGGPPRAAPSPPVSGGNDGMEPLAADPARAPDAFLVGEEYTGRTWSCRVSETCAEAPRIALSSLQAITSVRRLSLGRTAWLIRAFNPLTGHTVVRVRILGPEGADIDELVLDSGELSDLGAPGHKLVDNYEGLAAVERPDGTVRFYLVSDDNNGANGQRTLLLAFDWTPANRR